jgi:branched-chain amino acid transport system permease protein
MTSGLFINLLDMVVFIGIYGIVAVSLNLEYGFTGLGNFGKVAFLMIGAYTTAILSQAGVNFGLCLVASAAVSAVFGFLVSLPALRLREDYLAIVTLTFGEIIRIFIKAQGIGGGVRGISICPIFHFGTVLGGRLANIGLAFALLAVCFIFAQLVANSPYGRILRAIREDQTAAQSYGKSIQRYKAQVFTMGSAIAGIAGALLAQYNTFIEPSTFLPGLTFTFWIMVLLGGPGNNWGAVLGAAVVMVFEKGTIILKDQVDLPLDPTNLRFIMYGILILLVLFYRPGGLIKESPVKPPKIQERVNV